MPYVYGIFVINSTNNNHSKTQTNRTEVMVVEFLLRDFPREERKKKKND